MRSFAEAALWRWWSGEGGWAGRALSAAALPAELLFRGAVTIRAAAYASGVMGSRGAPLPVISVGNLTVGGTGKTPLVGWIVEALRGWGGNPAVALRGYGRDEALLLRRWQPSTPVYSHRRREQAVREAAAAGADVLVLDDGFQHRGLARDLDMVLLAAEQAFPGALLPRGPYREPAGALRRAGLVMITRKIASAAAADALEAAVCRIAPGVGVVRARLTPARWEDLDGRPVPKPTGAVLTVTAIAGPRTFAALVGRETAAPVEVMAFPDHHEYTGADLQRVRQAAGARVVVVTEKDAVKLRAHAPTLPEVRVLALDVEIEAGAELLLRRLREAAGCGPSRPSGRMVDRRREVIS